MILLPGVEFDDPLYYFGTKSSIYRSKSAQLAVGLMSVNQKELDERVSALCGVATLGDTDTSLSLFVAYGFEGSEMADRPVIIVGGESGIGRRTYLVGEIPFCDQTPIFPFLGIKRYSEDGDSHWGYTFPYFIYYSFGFGGD
jgi:hypothetical protein